MNYHNEPLPEAQVRAAWKAARALNQAWTYFASSDDLVGKKLHEINDLLEQRLSGDSSVHVRGLELDHQGKLIYTSRGYRYSWIIGRDGTITVSVYRKGTGVIVHIVIGPDQRRPDFTLVGVSQVAGTVVYERHALAAVNFLAPTFISEDAAKKLVRRNVTVSPEPQREKTR